MVAVLLKKNLSKKDIQQAMITAWKETGDFHWRCNHGSLPGVIVEKLIPDNTELKYTVIWGKVVGFLIDCNSQYQKDNGLPESAIFFTRNGINNSKLSPPHWWRKGVDLAEKIAKLALVDHVRVDFYYYNGEIVISEFYLESWG